MGRIWASQGGLSRNKVAVGESAAGSPPQIGTRRYVWPTSWSIFARPGALEPPRLTDLMLDRRETRRVRLPRGQCRSDGVRIAPLKCGRPIRLYPNNEPMHHPVQARVGRVERSPAYTPGPRYDTVCTRNPGVHWTIPGHSERPIY